MKKFFVTAAIRSNGIDIRVSISPFVVNSKEEAIGAIVIHSQANGGGNLPLQKTFAEEFTIDQLSAWIRTMQE